MKQCLPFTSQITDSVIESVTRFAFDFSYLLMPESSLDKNTVKYLVTVNSLLLMPLALVSDLQNNNNNNKDLI